MSLPGFGAQFSLSLRTSKYATYGSSPAMNDLVTPSRLIHRPLRYLPAPSFGGVGDCPEGWDCCAGPKDPSPCWCIPTDRCGVSGGSCWCYDKRTGDPRPPGN